MPRLFHHGVEPITLHSGERSCFKIDADALTPQDIDAIASLLGPQLRPFGAVEAVDSTSPVPGWMQAAFSHYSAGLSHPPLIVDDVLTTGTSMEEQRAGREAVGVVIFARRSTPPWITALLVFNPAVDDTL